MALGDSIARGYLLPEPEKQAYPAVICERLENCLPGTRVAYANRAVDGHTTADLLKLLAGGVPELNGADIVVLSIGANNILHPFLDCLTQISAALRKGSGDASAENEAAGEIFDKLNAFFESPEFAEAMETGVRSAGEDLKLIFSGIKARAPDAIVLIMSVYSPYHGMNFTLPYIEKSLLLGGLSDKWVSELNASIAGAAKEAGCVLVSTYEAFQNKRGLVNAGISILPPRFSLDPHPNLSGHIMLANLHLAALSGKEYETPSAKKEGVFN